MTKVGVNGNPILDCDISRRILSQLGEKFSGDKYEEKRRILLGFLVGTSVSSEVFHNAEQINETSAISIKKQQKE